MTGQYDRQGQADKLTAANIERQARDPFAGIPTGDDDTGAAEAAPAGTCPNCSHDGHVTGSICLRCGYALTIPELAAYLGTTISAIEAPATAAAVDPAPAAEAAPAVDPAPAAEAAPAVDLFKADWPYPQLTAAEFAGIYAEAADTIEARGYYAHEVHGYADEPGISITGALKLAAHGYVQAEDPSASTDDHYRRTADITEELETRLSAVLYVFGQVHNRTGIQDLSDVHVGWALGHFQLGPHPTAAHATTLLRQAARMFAALEPVTVAPAPLTGICLVHGGRPLSACDPAECPVAAEAEAARTGM